MRAPTSTEPAARESIALAVAIAAVISVAISWTLAQDVWTTGAFFDTDDATRITQVRDWMAGQGWYDLEMHRLGFPGAEPMHWTRIVDAPIALLIHCASLVLDPVMAERAARLAFPFLLSLGTFFVSALVAIELIGGASVLTTCLVVALAGLSMVQFQPGRVDHHAPQILLLLTSGLCLLRSIGGAQPRRAGFLSATCLAVSLAISLENLPAAGAIAAAFACLWAAQGEPRASALTGFGWGLLVATPVIYALTSAPARWLVVACDAQSSIHVSLALVGGATCVGLTFLGGRAAGPVARWGWLAAAAIAIAIVLRAAFPHCGLDPFGDIDPLVRSDWLDKVKEAFSLRKAWSIGLRQFVLVNYIPAMMGLVGVVVAILQSRGDARLRWIAWLGLAIVTLAVATFRIGYVQTLQVTSCFGAVYLVSLLPGRLRSLRIPIAFVGSVVFLAFVLPADAVTKQDAKNSAHCTRPEDASGLASLPPGRLLAPIDEGAYLLAFTQHQIVAAPYHRNNEGNRLEVEAFTLPAESALRLLAAHHVDYVAICGEERRDSPLIKALVGGSPSARRLEASGSYQVWRIAP